MDDKLVNDSVEDIVANRLVDRLQQPRFLAEQDLSKDDLG